MITFDCGHKGRTLDVKKINKDIYHDWLNLRISICFDCYEAQRVNEAIEQADSEHCAALFNGKVADEEVNHNV